MPQKFLNIKTVLLSISSLLIFAGLVGFTPQENDLDKKNRLFEERNKIARMISPFLKKNILSPEINSSFDSQWAENLKFEYTIDPLLQNEAEKLLKSYKPEYGVIFMMNAETGRVLAMTSYEKGKLSVANLNLISTFPAASVFKVVTATAAVDRAGLKPEQSISYNGGAYTLYRKNVMSDKVTRWTNVISLKNAFARSINSAFGRLSLQHLNPEDIEEYAHRYLFNKEIPADFLVDKGVVKVPPGKTFELTEVASGYNRTNTMSPVQGAMIAATVANNGKMVAPYIVKQIENQEGKIIYQPQTLMLGEVMTAESAKIVRELMEQTVTSGTSRRSFHTLMNDRRFSEIEIGGKTGHLTGNNPRGRVDWFVGYAVDNNEKIAIAALTVNQKYWTVKSSYLGQSMFRKYFSPIVALKSQRKKTVASR